MTPNRRWFLILLATASLTGCGKSLQQHAYQLHKKSAFKIGDQWIIRPPYEINATSIRLERTTHSFPTATTQPADSASVPDPHTQTLTIDLTNGRATLADSDGRSYPQQVEQSVVRRIHAYVAERSWQIRTIKAEKKAEQVTTYLLTVFEQNQPLKQTAMWSMPARKELPEVLTLLQETFDRAHRYAYPLSEDVNLLR